MNTFSFEATKRSLLASVAIVGLFAASPVMAQSPPAASEGQQNPNAIEQVTVTAQRRAERAVDVPVTIKVISATELKQAGINELSGIQTVTPAVRFDNAGAWVQPTIRGVGSDLVATGAGSNVGTYVDGYYLPNALASDFQLLNIENIQVLKGPQGTLFGHNTTGGAILVTTSKPSFDTSGTVDVSYGNYNTQRYEGYFTTGLTDNVAVDIAGLLSRGDGYTRDIVTGNDAVGAYENSSFRAGLRADLTDKISLLFHYEHTDTEDPTNYLYNAYVANGVPQVAGVVFNNPAILAKLGFPPSDFHSVYATKPHDIADFGATSFGAKTDSFQLTSTFDLDFATLNSYTQYSRLSGVTSNFNISIMSFNPAPGKYYPYVTASLVNKDGRTITQEFLLNSNSEGRLKWTAGVFYLDYTDPFFSASTATIPITIPPIQENIKPVIATADTISIAAYGDATYQVLDDLYFSAGVRYSHDEVQDNRYSNFETAPNVYVAGTNPNLTGDRFSPRAVLRYTPNDDSSVYASFSRGFKSAVANVGPASLTPPARPETINAYEVGYKYAGSGLSFDLSSFYYDYSNLQISEYTLPYSGAQAVGQAYNAAAARIYGVEGQVNYDVTSDFNVNAGAAYTEAQYIKIFKSPYFVQCTDPVSCDANGAHNIGLFTAPPTTANEYDAPMIRAPKYTANAGARYTMGLAGGNLVLAGNVYFTSRIYFDPSHQYSQGDYALLGLRAEWTDPSDMFTLALYGNNVTNTDYRSSVQATQGGIGNTWGAPATYGAEVRVRFE